MSTEEIISPEYAFQVSINPHQHPMFDRYIQHLLAMLVSLSNTCGGIVYLTANPIMKVTKGTFNAFHNRLLELTCRETKLPQQLMEVRQLENHKFWGCVIVEKFQHKLNYCLLQPTKNSTMTCSEYWTDILGFIHAQGAISEENNDLIAKGNHAAATEIQGAAAEIHASTAEIHGAAAEILEAPSPYDYPNKEDVVVQGFTQEGTPGHDYSGDNNDIPEEVVNYSMYSKLDWSNNKKDWKNYVETKYQSVDDIIKSCDVWKPAVPMRVTPDLDMLDEMFGSEAQCDEILSRTATEEPGFAIVCKTWNFILPEKIYHTSPEGRVCDVLTVSESGEISLWVILDANCETATREHMEYIMKTARMIKYQLVEQSYPACLKLHFHCNFACTRGGT